MVSKAFSHPASPAIGLGYKQITVETVNTTKKIAVCKDKLGNFVNVSLTYMRAKGPLPLPGEAWIIDRQYGSWTFALALKYDQLIVLKKFVETFNFVTAGLHSWQLTHNLNTINHTFNVYNAAHVHQTIFNVTAGTNVDTVSTVDPPAVTTYTFVAIG